MSPAGHRGLQGSRHVLWSNRANAGQREAGQHGADRPVTSSPSAEGCGMREEGAGPLSMKMAGRVTAQAHPLTAWGWMHNTLPNPSFPYPHPRSQSTSPSPRLTRAGRPEGCEFWQFLLFHRRKRNPQVDVPLFCRVASSQTPPPAFPCGQEALPGSTATANQSNCACATLPHTQHTPASGAGLSAQKPGASWSGSQSARLHIEGPGTDVQQHSPRSAPSCVAVNRKSPAGQPQGQHRKCFTFMKPGLFRRHRTDNRTGNH